jgi:phosphoribosylformylglycinamidine synthase
MKKVAVIILRTAGTNCDNETAFAFEKAGASTELVHINALRRREKILRDYQILAIPGGFTYGDDIASGKIVANELKFMLEDDLQRFIADGKLIIGICNGFQILVKSGLLPNLSGDCRTVETTLTLNDSDKFEDRWVHLKKGKSECIWTQGIDDVIYLPVAHGEGKFIPRDATVLKKLKEEGLIVFEYVDNKGKRTGYPQNPKGSVENIAGICDRSGRIVGLMPHPERHIHYCQHPSWTRRDYRGDGDGLAIFRNGVDFAKKNLS